MQDKYNIEIVLTNSKKIKLCLETKYAPKTVENFINLVKNKYYDGTIFHRIIASFMIQTGGYKLEQFSLKELGNVDPIKGEFSSNGFLENTLQHKTGVISMARTQNKNSATSQFFICAADCPWLDGEYAAFGYATDEESIQNILEVSEIETGQIGSFTDFPCEIIGIKTINLL